MVNRRSDEETVAATERVLENNQASKLPKSSKPPDTRPVTITKVKTFTCPACKEVLEEVTAVNSKVQGWCGRSHTYVNEKVS